MAYTKTTWLDRAVQFANRYLKSGETSTGVTLTADPGVVTQAGTPINAAQMNKIEQGIADAHAALSRTATLVVAASNSTAAGKAAADYVCTGTNDQTTINNAITALGANAGKVVLLEGLFAIAAAISISSNVSLEGQGNGTVLQIPNANNTSFNVIQNADSTNGNTGISISNLKIDGNKANNTAGTQTGIWFTKVTYSTVQNVTVVNMRTYGYVFVTSSNNMVTGNSCRGSASDGIWFQTSSSYNTITGNNCQGNIDGISLSSSSNNNTITGNTCGGSVWDGISCSTNNNTIIGNMCQGNGLRGIWLTGASNNTVSGNTCLENSQTTHNTSDNIMVDGTSNTNNIQGNTCRQGALTNKPRYGIRINVAGCTGNFVTNNDLTTGGATGAFSDVGTGTITTAGNKLA